MRKPRLPRTDPRTLARDIPGLLDGLFPHLVPGIVANLNRQVAPCQGCVPVDQEDVDASTLAGAMLFELAVAVTEQLLSRRLPDWDAALLVAVKRQQRHFDAREPVSLRDGDKGIALQVASNLVSMLRRAESEAREALVIAPTISGYQWIASGVGDFAIGTTLVEVKCTRERFSSADYRQVLIYWLLSYAAAIERDAAEWTQVTLLNPRHAYSVTLRFDELVRLLAAGRSKVELLELFATIVDERRGHMVT